MLPLLVCLFPAAGSDCGGSLFLLESVLWQGKLELISRRDGLKELGAPPDLPLLNLISPRSPSVLRSESLAVLSLPSKDFQFCGNGLSTDKWWYMVFSPLRYLCCCMLFLEPGALEMLIKPKVCRYHLLLLIS